MGGTDMELHLSVGRIRILGLVRMEQRAANVLRS
jgi:hypothetical protein